MRANWDAPACQWRSDLPADCTLREHGRALKAQGLSYGDIGKLFGMGYGMTKHGCWYQPGSRKPRKQRAEPLHDGGASRGRPLSTKDKRNIGKAYGMTWAQLQAIRAAGLTVKQFRERAEERKQTA